MFNVFGIELHLYGLMLGLGALAALYSGLWLTRKNELDTSEVESAFWWLILAGIIGARLYHVIDKWHIYRQDLVSIVYIWKGGLGIFGGIIGGLIGLLLYLRLRHTKITFWQLFDVAAFGMPLAQATGRLGNYINGELYGKPTNLPWGTLVKGQRVHPLFAYEALLNVGLFYLLYRLATKTKVGLGKIGGIYLFGYGAIRFVLEPLRPEIMVWIWQGIPVAEIFSVAAMVVGLVIYIQHGKRTKQAKRKTRQSQ